MSRPRQPAAARRGAAADDKRLAILEGSAHVIAERGVRGLRIDDVAKAAGVSPGLPFYHFTDRTGLLTAALQFINQRSRDLRLHEPMTDSPRANLIAQSLGEFQDDPLVRENSRAWNELRASAVFEPELRGPVAETTNTWNDELGAIIAEAIDAGEIVTDMKPSAAARELTALIEGFSGRWLTGELTTQEARAGVQSAIERLLPVAGGPRSGQTTRSLPQRTFEVVSALQPPASPAPRGDRLDRRLRVAVVQHAWDPDASRLQSSLGEQIAVAAGLGAKIAFLPELTLSRFPADQIPGSAPGDAAEDLLNGPTFAFAAEIAARHGLIVEASLYERAASDDGLGYNTAIMVSPSGELLGRTRKVHIPSSPGYYEDSYFRPAPAAEAYPVYSPAELDGARVGVPTCWDQWFPELSRIYSLNGAEIIAYPSAIGSEPDYPDFDTQPLWERVIVGNAISAGTFMVVANRYGNEGSLTFYGSSFICDPFGRILVQAPRDRACVLVAELDLELRADWLTLFPFHATRRPDTYARLSDPRVVEVSTADKGSRR
jgi:N-carbamoylputrescine amidase